MDVKDNTEYKKGRAATEVKKAPKWECQAQYGICYGSRQGTRGGMPGIIQKRKRKGAYGSRKGTSGGNAMDKIQGEKERRLWK